MAGLGLLLGGILAGLSSTPFAGQCAARQAAEKAAKCGVKEVEVRVKGPGAGRESAITALEAAGLGEEGTQAIVKAVELLAGIEARQAS